MFKIVGYNFGREMFTTHSNDYFTARTLSNVNPGKLVAAFENDSDTAIVAFLNGVLVWDNRHYA